MDDYYVYVYIDPRNFQEFYYGKGKGSRKEAHLQDANNSEKTRRIKAIQDQGLTPIIRVIASRLSEHDALLIEKTLLWKLGKSLANIATGHYSDNFRPHDTLHLELPCFDFQNGIFYYNIGEGPHRNWDDYVRFGFISGGQGIRWRDAMRGFREGDVIAAYLKGRGFVGIGIITSEARPVREFRVTGRSLLDEDLVCKGIFDNCDSNEQCEYVAQVNWVATVNRESAKWKARSSLYTTTHIRASLEGQPKTRAFLEKEFGLSLRQLLGSRIDNLKCQDLVH